MEYVPIIFFSGVGFVYLSYGKKRPDLWVGISGVLLLGYPLFVGSLVSQIVVGVVLMVLPFILKYLVNRRF